MRISIQFFVSETTKRNQEMNILENKMKTFEEYLSKNESSKGYRK